MTSPKDRPAAPGQPAPLREQAAAALWLVDALHRLALHHAFWFLETERRLGTETAFEKLNAVYDRMRPLLGTRVAQALNRPVDACGLPRDLLALPAETLSALERAVALSWLATDGLWFQSVEFDQGLDQAREINNACWARFSPLEARSIRHRLGRSGPGDLDGLQEALGYRLYAAINRQTIVHDGPDSLILYMNACRVQDTRRRKGLPDYPCKSGGIVEYTTFARAVNPAIATECLCCPPDPHPADYYCAWRFTLRPAEDAGGPKREA